MKSNIPTKEEIEEIFTQMCKEQGEDVYVKVKSMLSNEEDENLSKEKEIPERLKYLCDELNKNDKGYKYIIRDINDGYISTFREIGVTYEDSERYLIGTEYDNTLNICCHREEEMWYALSKISQMEGRYEEFVKFFINREITLPEYSMELGFTTDYFEIKYSTTRIKN